MTISKDEKIIGNFRIGRVIGSGTFGKVRQGVHLPTGQKVAIKMLEKKKIKTSKDIQRIQKELEILKEINHPNILKLYEVKQTDNFIAIVTELASGEQLYDRIVKKTTLSLEQTCKYFCQLLLAVKFLHSRNVAHRDIKPENIIVNGERLKLIDFGLSTEWMQGKIMMETPCGSPCYAAPEMVTGKKYDCRKVDVWAMGVTLFAMLVGKLPFQHQNTLKLYKIIENSEFEDVKAVPSYVNILLRAMIEKDPKKRITIAEIEENIWIKDTLKIYKNTSQTTTQWNQSIIREMQSAFNKSSKKILSQLTNSPISEYATYYHLKANKIHQRNSIHQEEVHNGPFHIQFVFKNINCLEVFLEKNDILYKWVSISKQSQYEPELNDQKQSGEEPKIKRYIKVNGQIFTLKRLNNLPKFIYLPLNNVKLKNQDQDKKLSLCSNHIQRSHTHLDSSRSNMDKMCIETF